MKHERQNRAGRLARLGLATTLIVGGNSAIASAEQPLNTPSGSNTPTTETLPVVNVNTVLESQLKGPEDQARLEQFAKDNGFTEINLSTMSNGMLAIDNAQIATWGMEPLEDSAFESKTVISAPSGPFNHRYHVEPQDIENLIERDRSLEIGLNKVVPSHEGDNQIQWGTVLIPGKDVRVLVRTVGNPTSYRLFSVHELYGVPFEGYFLYFESDSYSADNAINQGIESIDGTQLPEIIRSNDPFKLDEIINPVPTSPEIIVLPNSPAETAQK